MDLSDYLSNTYFEGEARGRRIRHSKDKRTDCPLLTLGLVLDASGFVLPGLRQRARTPHARRMLALDAPRAALVMMDRGIATEDRLHWLREQGYRYLVVSRERTRHFDASGAAHRDRVEARRAPHKVLSDDGQEVRLYCFSEERAAKERGIAERPNASRTHSPSSPIGNDDQVWQRIGRLAAASPSTDIELDTDESGERATAVRFTRRALPGSMMTHPGVYCLRSSETDWDEATLWRTYFTLTDLEAVFRSLNRSSDSARSITTSPSVPTGICSSP